MADHLRDFDPDPSKKKIMNLYAAFGVSLILSLVPMGSIALISIIFLLGVLIAAYVVRNTSADEGLAENHATYIIRTIWISALFGFLSIMAGAAYMFTQGVDYSSFQACADGIANKASETGNMPSNAEFFEASEPCMDDFMAANADVFLTATIIAATPILLYIVYRYVKGLTRAIKGYRIANPREWF